MVGQALQKAADRSPAGLFVRPPACIRTRPGSRSLTGYSPLCVAAKIYQESHSRISVCHCRYRTVVRDRPIFDARAHAPGQPFACNLKIAMPATGRVVRQTVVGDRRLASRTRR